MKFLNTGILLVATSLYTLALGQVGQLDQPSREFKVLAYGDGLFQGIFFEVETEEGLKQIDLEFRPDGRSRAYSIPGGQEELEFLSMNSDGAEAINRGSVTVPFDADRFLLLFSEAPGFGEGEAYDIDLIDESSGIWGGGCYRFLNLTGISLECELGEYSGELIPGLSAIMRFPVENAKPIDLKLSLNTGNRKKVLYHNSTVPDTKYGRLIVVKPPASPESTRVRVLTIW